MVAISKGNGVVNMQKSLLVVSVVLFIIKITAWCLTGSVAILTDALESTVNVVAGIIGLYSIVLSAKPKDQEHPYGHGKVEFLSSALEGLLISIAGLFIVYESLNNLIHGTYSNYCSCEFYNGTFMHSKRKKRSFSNFVS